MSSDASSREKALMEYLWDKGRPVTSMEIFENLEDVMCNITYVHRALQVLEKRGLIKAVGLVRVNKKYARTFSYIKSREEVAADYAREIGVASKNLGRFALALVKDEEDDEASRDELIAKLEEIIAELKDEDDGE